MMVIRLLVSHLQFLSSYARVVFFFLGGSGDGCWYVPDTTGYPPKTVLQLQNIVEGLVWPFFDRAN